MRANPAFIALSLLLASLAAIAPPAQATHTTCSTAESASPFDVKSGSVASGDLWYSHTTTATGIASYVLQPAVGSDVNLAVFADCASGTPLCTSHNAAGVADRCAVASTSPGATSFKVRVSAFAGPGGFTLSFRPDCEITVGVSACLLPTTDATPALTYAEAAGPEHNVAAYVDLYRFTLSDGFTVTLDCVRLVADGNVPNACDELGTFVSRTATLVDHDLDEPTIEPLPPPVRVCRAALQLLVLDRGLERQDGAFTTCSSSAAPPPLEPPADDEPFGFISITPATRDQGVVVRLPPGWTCNHALGGAYANGDTVECTPGPIVDSGAGTVDVERCKKVGAQAEVMLGSVSVTSKCPNITASVNVNGPGALSASNVGNDDPVWKCTIAWTDPHVGTADCTVN